MAVVTVNKELGATASGTAGVRTGDVGKFGALARGAQSLEKDDKTAFESEFGKCFGCREAEGLGWWN
jgi:hypothetical protein